MIKVSTTGMAVSLKTDLRFPESGQHGHGSRIIHHLKPYNYFEYLLTEIPKHMDDHDTSFCEDLLPWSAKLPVECRK